jgi:2-polyprenyl-3-methyl-5-hydroxy-6-metoxy-1,4-benzoquinol methylase
MKLVEPGARLLDVGCGTENWLVRSAHGIAPDSLGIDPDLEQEFVDERGRRATVEDIASVEPASFDAVTSLAVIEHLPPPSVAAHIASIGTALVPGGRLVLTTPTPRARPVLEFLAFRLHLISAHEISDHKHYYNRDELLALFEPGGWDVEHRSFQLGFNQRILARRDHDES